MAGVYYNENDPAAAAWLAELIRAGALPAGWIDTRSILDVRADDVRGFKQCHWFAGIGGWPHALALARVPAGRSVWTGSCPCQPFSAIGKGDGFGDPRHLWPAWKRLIAECKPATLFGEQVSGAFIEPWIDLIQADLECLGYAFGCVPFPAASVGAPHIRDRAYWVGYADGAGLEGFPGDDGAARRAWPAGPVAETSLPLHWGNPDWAAGSDGQWRPFEPGTFPLAHGVQGRVGRLRGYGNAIVPQQAAEFVLAADEARADLFAIVNK